MANERVSQLNELTAAQISSEDIFLVGDMSAKESKKMTAQQLILFVEASSSFSTIIPTVLADTASYVLGSHVYGNVASASYALLALTASNAIRALSASNADTASYVNLTITSVSSASYLNYTGAANGTSSYSIGANTSNLSLTASSLAYPNVSTASYALTSSLTISSSYAKNATTSSYVLTSSYSLSTVTASYVFTSVSSSYSTTSSYAANAVNAGPKFLTSPYIIPASINADVAWTTLDSTLYGVTSNATALILQTLMATGTGPIYMYFRKNSSSYILTASLGAFGASDNPYVINQQVIPTDVGALFDYKIIRNSAPIQSSITIIGYY